MYCYLKNYLHDFPETLGSSKQDKGNMSRQGNCTEILKSTHQSPGPNNTTKCPWRCSLRVCTINTQIGNHSQFKEAILLLLKAIMCTRIIKLRKK